MKKVTLTVDDDLVLAKVEAEAATSGRSLQEIVVEALEQWLADGELNQQERAEVDAALKDWEEHGGMEAHEFFDKLRKEEAGA